MKSSDSTDFHHQLKVLFAEIADLHPNERAAKLASLTDDQTLTERTLALAAHLDPRVTQHTRGLTRSRDPLAKIIDGVSGPELAVGDVIGAWRLASALGQGGMGSVYLAERNDGHFAQQAAVKVLQGIPTPEALALLARERQILANLTHPNIAHLLDGGATPRGQPYLVIEYVPGVAIDQYCVDQKLGHEAVLRLLLTVFDAVAFAHRQLIIHCDIKPSNVLVDSNGRPVLLDFGIARLVEKVEQFDPAVENDAATGSGVRFPEPSSPPNPMNDSSSGARAFTPRYASPEQTRGGTVGTASDVYSLGALLSELVQFPQSVATPGSRKTLAGARGRQAEIYSIIQRATAVDPADRYPTVDAFAKDITRYLNNFPVAAMLQGALYSSKKFVQRRWGVTLTAIAFATTVGVFTEQLIDERNAANLARAEALRERDLATDAQRAAQRAEAVAVSERDRATGAEKAALQDRDRAVRAERNAQTEAMRALRAEAKTQIEAANTRETRDFMLSLFNSGDPQVGGDPKMTAFELLKRGTERVEAMPASKSGLKAELLLALGQIHENLGLPKGASELYRQIEPLAPDSVIAAQTLGRLAMLGSNTSNHASAEAPARKSLAIRQKLFARGSPEIADAENTLGTVLIQLNKREESEKNLLSALAIREKLYKGNNTEVAATLHNLGLHYAEYLQPQMSETCFLRSLVMKRELFGKNHPRVLITLENLAKLYASNKRLADAEKMWAELYQARVDIYGQNSQWVSVAANEWASVLQDLVRFDESEKRYRESISNPVNAPDADGKRSMSYAITVNNLATLLEDRGDLSEAEKFFRESLAIRRSRLKSNDPSVARTEHNLGRVLLREGKLGEAKALLTQSYASRLAARGAKHGDTQESLLMLAECAVIEGDVAVATSYLQQLDDTVLAQKPARFIQRRRVEASIAVAKQESPIPQLRERVTIATKELGAAHLTTYRTKLDLAEALTNAGQISEAQTLIAPIQTAFLAPLARNAIDRQRVAALSKQPAAQTNRGPSAQ
jgi:eukaryotic-like serine/threonine-protein kinase